MKFAVISIKPKYVEAIIEGQKTYELRRRKPKLATGDKLIIYQTSPGRKVMAIAEIEHIINEDLTNLWESVKNNCAVSFDDYINYFEGCSTGYALKLKNVKPYEKPITLEALRGYMPKYSPPQFFHFLNETHPLYTLLVDTNKMS